MALASYSKFRRRHITLELRYDNAYLLWDRSGIFWHDIKGMFKELKSREIAPSQMVCVADNRFVIQINLDKLVITDHRFGKDEENTVQVMSDIYKVAREYLRLTTLNRVGTRIIAASDFPTKNRAFEFLEGLRLVKVPADKMFGLSSSNVNPTYKIEVQDGDVGYTGQIYYQNRSLSIELVPEVNDLGFSEQTKKLEEVVIDLDFFTTKPMSVASFSPERWMERWLRAAKRDSEAMLNLAVAR